MATKFLLTSLLLLSLTSALRAESYNVIAMDVGENRVQCRSLSRLPFCYRPISNLLRHGRPLTNFCCGIIYDISDPCDYLFRHRHWFVKSRNNCAANSESPPPAPPAHRGFQHVAPHPAAAPGFYTAPTPAPVTPQQADLPQRRILATIEELGAFCQDSIKRFDACANNFAGNIVFNDAIKNECCEAVMDVISVCSPYDWPSAPWLFSSSDRCINPDHIRAN